MLPAVPLFSTTLIDSCCIFTLFDTLAIAAAALRCPPDKDGQNKKNVPIHVTAAVTPIIVKITIVKARLQLINSKELLTLKLWLKSWILLLQPVEFGNTSKLQLVH